ncbi:hypothetical protein IKT18_01875 [Candidatus Saccharibacteria bacterium]|nr:hypothetical protein [Candidatus Saccharibacteria bacterium]
MKKKKKQQQKKKKRNLVPKLIVLLVFDVILMLGSLSAYIFLARDYNILYSENGDVTTSVILKENEFFEKEYEKKSNEYVASLIDYINANFRYSFDALAEGVNLKGSYKIIAEVNVLDKVSHNTIYNYEDELVPNTELALEEDFNKTIRINYVKYNGLISKFISVYDLDGTESTLTVTMYVDVATETDLNVKNANKSARISFSVPLTTKTVAVSISKNDFYSNDFLKVQQTGNKTPFLIFALMFLVIAVFEFFDIARRIRRARTPLQNYQREIEKIEKNYSAFLQPITEPYKIGKNHLVEAETLEDLFEIRDSLQSPVLMYQKDKPQQTEFIIPATNNNTVYRFIFKVTDANEKE